MPGDQNYKTQRRIRRIIWSLKKKISFWIKISEDQIVEIYKSSKNNSIITELSAKQAVITLAKIILFSTSQYLPYL